MKRITFLLLATVMFLTSCAPAAPAPAPTPAATTTPTAIPTATPTPEPTPTATPMSLSDHVQAFVDGKIEFPADLTREQYSAFIKEMNAQRGQKPIYVEAEDATGKVVLYHDVASNEMKTLPGSFADNKDIIDQNSYPMFVEVYQEEGKDLEYVHPDTGERMILPNSADVDWTKIIDENNYQDGYMQLPTGNALTITEGFVKKSTEKYQSVYIQVILLDESPIILTSSQGIYRNLECLDTLFMRTNINGKPLYAVRIFSSKIGFSFFMKEGEPIEDKLVTVQAYESKLKPNQLYFLRAPIDENYIWETNIKGRIDQLENTSSVKQSYDDAIYNMVPSDGNVIFASGLVIEKVPK